MPVNSPDVKEGTSPAGAVQEKSPSAGLLRRLAQGALGVALLGGLLWLLLRKIEWPKFMAALRHMDLRYLALAVVIDITLNLTAFVQRLRTLLKAFPVARRERFVDLALLSAASYAAGTLLPGQPGLALRTVELRRRYGYQYSDVITAQLVEKLIEVVSISMLGWLALLGRPPRAVAITLWLVVLGAPAGALVLLWASRLVRAREGAPVEGQKPTLGARVRAALVRVGDSVGRLQQPGLLLRSLAWSVVSHLCGVLAVGLCLLGMGLSYSVPTWALLYMVVNLALVMPLTPGQVGIVEAGVVGALELLGAQREPALAFALVYHVAQVLPTTLLGIAVLPSLWPRVRTGGDAPQPSQTLGA